MKTTKMYEVDDEVMIKVKIAGVEIKNGELQYRIKDTKSTDCLPYLYEDKDIIPVESMKEKVTAKKQQ